MLNAYPVGVLEECGGHLLRHGKTIHFLFRQDMPEGNQEFAANGDLCLVAAQPGFFFLTHAWHWQGFATGMSSYPIFAAGIATYNGFDGAHLRYQLLKPGRVDVQVEEENENSGHAAEEVHFAVVQYQISNVTLTATGFGKRTRQYYSGMAMREAGRVYYLLTDHLGSTSEVVDMKMDVGNRQDALISRVRYMPFGEQRYSSATPPTNQTYTGQYDEPGLGLMFYNARWYDPSLGRFIEADSIVPESGNPSAWDRYAYVVNNPLKYSDSSGHCWGVFDWVRNIPTYGTTCDNLDMALVIVTSPDTSIGEKSVAGAYIAVEGAAHAAVLIGAAGAACGTVAPCAAAAETALGIGAAACSDGDCTNEAEAGVQITQLASQSVHQGINVFQNLSKFDARVALRTGVKYLSNGQIQKALDILGKGRADNLVLNVLENGNAQFFVERAGHDGFQRLIYTIDSTGKVIGLLQQAFNSLGELVHQHDKINNVIFK